MSRRAVGTALVGAWVVCIGWLAVRQITRPPEAFLDAGASRLAPGAAFYQIVLDGTPIGNAGITLDTTLTGYRLTETWNMDVRAGDGSARHVLRSESVLSRSLRLQSQVVNLSEAGMARQNELRWGREAGEPDSTFTLVISRPTERPATASVVTEGGVTVPTALSYRLRAERRLGSQGSLSQRVASPLTGRIETQSIRVLGDTVLAVADSAVWDSTSSRWVPVPAPASTAWRVERMVDGMPARELLDGQGLLIRRTWAFGPTLERSPFELNYSTYQAALRRGAISLPGRIPGIIPRSALPGPPDTSIVEMVVRVSRSDGPAWPNAAQGFAGGRQAVHGDTVVIRREASTPGGPPTQAELELRAVRSQPVAAAYRDAMASLPARADTLVHLVRWVGSSIRLLPDSAGALSASGAARARAAAVEGKVDLLAALARSAGMPTRIVSGVDLARLELPSHSWAEVWRGDRWVAVDPVFGQAPAAASLLRVTTGPAARPLALVPLVGSLRTTVLAETR